MKRIASISTTVLLLTTVLSLSAQSIPPKYSLVFGDDFNSGVLDQSKWNYRADSKASSAQLPANVALNSDALNIDVEKQNFAGYAFTGGGVISKESFRYGYYHVRAMVTANPGWHTSFWVMAGDGMTTFSPDARTEIDDFEIDTDNPTSVSMGYLEWDNRKTVGSARCNKSYHPGFSTAVGFHDYGFEWTESSITYYIDGAQVCTQPYPASVWTHDLVHIWLTSIGYNSDISVEHNPSPNKFANVGYYVRDYYVNALEQGYAEYGAGWSNSALAGFSALPTRSTRSAGAIAQWTPTILAAGKYNVQIWKVQHASSDPAALVTVNYSGGDKPTTVDFTTGPSGWVDLGAYDFATGATGNVTLACSGKGTARASMVKFVRQ